MPNPDRHETDDCWANPHNPDHKPDVYKKRQYDAFQAGIYVKHFNVNWDPDTGEKGENLPPPPAPPERPADPPVADKD